VYTGLSWTPAEAKPNLSSLFKTPASVHMWVCYLGVGGVGQFSGLPDIFS
jgi:hypothetical protein